MKRIKSKIRVILRKVFGNMAHRLRKLKYIIKKSILTLYRLYFIISNPYLYNVFIKFGFFSTISPYKLSISLFTF